MRKVTFDIETNGFLYDATKVHCISYSVDGELRTITRLDEYKGFIELLKDPSVKEVVGHNICTYDLPVLEKILKQPIYSEIKHKVVDTYLLSCISNPDRRGGHSLESYSQGSVHVKVDVSDWSRLTPLMAVRCEEDVGLTGDVYWQYMGKVPRDSLELEQDVAYIHSKQVHTGVPFDKLLAKHLIHKLDWEIEWMSAEIQEEAPLKVDRYKGPEVKKPFKKNGEYTQQVIKYYGGELETHKAKVEGPFSRINIRPINLNNSEEVKSFLLSLGWVPKEYNYTFKDGRKKQTSPKLTEESYESLPPGLGQKIARLNTIKHRRRYIANETDPTKGAIACIRDDGRVSAEAITCGTPTARYRHSKAVCNIPRPSSVLGKEIRSLFCTEDGEWMLGMDLAQIEARMLAHYLLKGGYPGAKETAERILCKDKGNDFHSYNAKMWGVSRDTAKSGLYA